MTKPSSPPAQLLFLPGASGRTDFWQPVAARLKHPATQIHLGWPGFGPTPADPNVRGFDDLVALVLARIDRPTALIAQSMGGVIALRAALVRPALVTHLVLTATSGGLDTQSLGAVDWRPQLHAAQPTLPRWFADEHRDLTPLLPTVHAPTLLLWGDADPISPVAVGKRLAQLLPATVLHILPGGDHDLALSHAPAAAALIDRHLGRTDNGTSAAG